MLLNVGKWRIEPHLVEDVHEEGEGEVDLLDLDVEEGEGINRGLSPIYI